MIIRNGVKLILLNQNNELLLMSTDDKSICNSDGKYHGLFWQMIGGEIEAGETLEEAAYRELHEETGLNKSDVVLENVVWYGELDLCLRGIQTHIAQKFILARAKTTQVSLQYLTNEEKLVVKDLKWFSLQDIENCPDIIYPVLLQYYLLDIINEKCIGEPIFIDLAKQPQQ